MTGSQSATPLCVFASALPTEPALRKSLVIKSRQPLPAALRGPDGNEVSFATFAMVDGELLARLGPDVVLAPLMTSSFDVLDLALRLVTLGYRGTLRAVTRKIPNPRLVEHEIASAYPELSFELIVLDAD